MREEHRGRMEAVVRSLQDADWNFSKASITWTVRNLLDIYGPKAGWSYIEENNYQIVVDCITSDKKLKQNKYQMRSGRDGKAANGPHGSRALLRGAEKAAATLVPSQMEETVFCGSPNEGHSPDSPDIRCHQRHLWSVRCGLPNLPCFWEPYEGEQPVLDVTEAEPGPGPELGSDGDYTGKSGGDGDASCGRLPDSAAEKSDDNGVHHTSTKSFEAGFQVKVRGKRSRPSLGKDIFKQTDDVSALGSPPLAQPTCGTEPSNEGSRSVGENPSPSVVSNESVHEAGVPTAGAPGRADIIGQVGPDLQPRLDSMKRSLGLAEAQAMPEGMLSEDNELQLASKRRKAGENGLGMLRKIRGCTTARGAIVPHGANGTSAKGFSTRTHLAEPTENAADFKTDISPNVENVTGSVWRNDAGLQDEGSARTLVGVSNNTLASVPLRTEQKSVKLAAQEAQLCKPEPVRQERIPLPPGPKVQTLDSSKPSSLCPLDPVEPKPLFDEKKESGDQGAVPLQSPRLPPGFEGKFTCTVSQEDSSLGRKLACVKGSENGPQVSAKRASSGDAVVQTTACSSNGKEQLHKDGSQTDSDDVPASARAQNSLPDCAAQATGSCEAYPASQGVSPRTPNAIPTWPATWLPPDSSGSHPQLSASKAGNSTKNTLPPTPNCPGVCHPPIVSGPLSTTDPELPPLTGPIPPSLTGTLRGMLSGSPTPNVSPLDHGENVNVVCPPATACPGLSAPAGPSSSGACAFTPVGGTTPSPRKQSVAQPSHMSVGKQKVPESSSASTPVAVEVHGNVPGRAVLIDGRGAGSSGDIVTGSGMSSHLADPIRSVYLGKIPKGLKDIEASVREVVRALLNSFEFVPQKIARLEEFYLRERPTWNFGFVEFSTPKVAMVFLDACQADPGALPLNGGYLKVGRNNQDLSGDTLQRNKLFPQTRDRDLDPVKVIYVGNVTPKWQDETALRRYFSNILKGSDEHLNSDLVRAVYLLPSQSDAYLELFSEHLADSLIYKCMKDPKLLEVLGENTFFCRHPKWVPLCAARFVRRRRSAPHSIFLREIVPVKEFCDQSTLHLAQLPIKGDGYYFRQRLQDLFEAVLRTLSIEKKIHGSIRNFSWPPGKPFAYIDFDSEEVADAIMDQYIDKVQSFCVKDMSLLIFRHQKYIRPGAIYRHSARNVDPVSGRAFEDDLERRAGVFEDVEHGSEVDTGPSDSAGRKALKSEKTNSPSVSGSLMGPNDCASSTLHSNFFREMKRSQLEGPKRLTLKGLARGAFEPALRGALNELFERALCESGVLEPEMQVVRSVTLGSEPYVTVSGSDVARALLQCRMPLKLGGERLTLHPLKIESRGQTALDAHKKIPSFEQGGPQGPSDPTSMRPRWVSPRASGQLAPLLGGWGAEPWGRPSHRFGPPVAPDASFPRGMGPPPPPYPPDCGRPAAPRVPPFCSPPPGYSDPPGGLLVPPWRPGPHPTWHYEGSPEHVGHQSTNSEALRGQETKSSDAEFAGVPPHNRRRSSLEGRLESDDSRQKKPRIQDSTEVVVDKSIGGWLEAEEDDEDGKPLPSNLLQDKDPGIPEDTAQHLQVSIGDVGAMRRNSGETKKASSQQGSLVCGAGVVDCDRDREGDPGFAVNELEDKLLTRTFVTTSGCHPGVKLDSDDKKHARQPGQGGPGLPGAEPNSVVQLECIKDEDMKLKPALKDAPCTVDSACRNSPPRQRDVLQFDLNEIMVESPDGPTPVRDECVEPPGSLPNKKGTSHQSGRDADLEHKRPSSAEKGTSKQQSLDYKRRDDESPSRWSPSRDSRRSHTWHRDDRRSDRSDTDHPRRTFDEPRLYRKSSRHDSDDRRPKHSSLHRSSTMPRPSSSLWPDVRISDEDRQQFRDARSVDEDRHLYRRNRSFDEVRDARRRYRPER